MRYRLLLAAWLNLHATLCAGAVPEPGLTCERLYAVAKSAVQYRDEGYTLKQVLAALKSEQDEGKLTAGEIETLRKAITLVYLGNAWPEEVAIECRNARGAK